MHLHGEYQHLGEVLYYWSKFKNMLGLEAREEWIPGSPLYLDFQQLVISLITPGVKGRVA